MEQNSSETDTSSGGQEIPRILWNLKVHLPFAQESPACLYPEPDESISRPSHPSVFVKVKVKFTL
jgi:hypothetical protein